MKTITEQNRGYENSGNRKRAVAQLAKRGFNHFVLYKDTQSDFALQYGRAAWVAQGTIYVCR